eukprot:scaffold137139_cov38-Prasinocladus_malaysianus.AAC.1
MGFLPRDVFAPPEAPEAAQRQQVDDDKVTASTAELLQKVESRGGIGRFRSHSRAGPKNNALMASMAEPTKRYGPSDDVV